MSSQRHRMGKSASSKKMLISRTALSHVFLLPFEAAHRVQRDASVWQVGLPKMQRSSLVTWRQRTHHRYASVHCKRDRSFV